MKSWTLKSISTDMKNSPGAFKNMSEKAEENIDKAQKMK